MEIRWDTARLLELSANLDGKGTLLMARRGDVIEACARVARHPIELRALVIAALWAESRAADLKARQRLLTAAESQLLWDLAPPPPDDRSGPAIRSRDLQDIEDDLDVALRQGASIAASASGLAQAQAGRRITELMYELAVAARNSSLVARRVPPSSSALSDLIDYLGYEIALMQPDPHLDRRRVAGATSAIRRLLDESWFRDVGRTDLLTIHEILANLAHPELDAVVRELSDDELFRWFHELDGVRGGNLSDAEEAELFDMLARAASAATLLRLARAEGGSRFMQIASAVRRAAPPHVGMEFIEACVAHASDGDEALIAALAGLAALDRRRRNVVVASLHFQGLLDPLSAATAVFLDRQKIERDDPIVIEFFEGLGSAIGTAVLTLGELTVAGVVDRDAFRSSWSQVGGLAAMAFTDPRRFGAIVIDLETLRRNPARWTGSAAAAFAASGAGRLARAGHFGKLTGSAARWLKRLADTVIINGKRLQLRGGHVPPVLDRLGVALDAAAIREAVTELALVEGHVGEIDALYVPSSGAT